MKHSVLNAARLAVNPINLASIFCSRIFSKRWAALMKRVLRWRRSRVCAHWRITKRSSTKRTQPSCLTWRRNRWQLQFARRCMAVRIYRDKDVDLAWLKGKTCAVIGFGAQGHAHALNLRDSGMRVVVGLYRGSKSRIRAKRNRLRVLETADAVRRSDIIFLALPDTKMPAVYKKEIAPNLRAGQTVLFAHGFAICYRTIVPRKDVDVVMVA